MALLTDGNPNDALALEVYESAILNVAHVETIDLEIKLTLATAELAEDVWTFCWITRVRSIRSPTIRRSKGVSDVVVSPQMQRWHALHTLENRVPGCVQRSAQRSLSGEVSGVSAAIQRRFAHTVRFGIGLALTPIPQGAASGAECSRGQRRGGNHFMCK